MLTKILFFEDAVNIGEHQILFIKFHSNNFNFNKNDKL